MSIHYYNDGHIVTHTEFIVWQETIIELETSFGFHKNERTEEGISIYYGHKEFIVSQGTIHRIGSEESEWAE